METGVVITGIGLSTCLGRDVESTWQALVAGETGLGPLRRFDVSGSAVKNGGVIPETGNHESGRALALGLVEAVCREALGAAPAGDPARTGLILGTSLAGSASNPAFWEQFLERGPLETDFRTLESYDVEPFMAELAERLGVEGETALVSNACAAGASSIALATDLIRLGRVDRVFAVGYDTLELHTFAGFRALGALSEVGPRPFGRERDGMQLSDGFGVLLLEREDSVTATGARARILGYGESADAHNLTQPHPEGSGAALAMTRALEMAGVAPGDIDYVNLHATATPSNDIAEYRALRTVFGDELGSTPLHALKPALGHSLGGAGAVEAAIALLVLEHQFVPPTLGVTELEKEMDPVDLDPKGRECEVRLVMSNSFGFGGCNASLIFGAPAP